MKDIRRLLERWQLDVGDVRERMYRALELVEQSEANTGVPVE